MAVPPEGSERPRSRDPRCPARYASSTSDVLHSAHGVNHNVWGELGGQLPWRPVALRSRTRWASTTSSPRIARRMTATTGRSSTRLLARCHPASSRRGLQRRRGRRAGERPGLAHGKVAQRAPLPPSDRQSPLHPGRGGSRGHGRLSLPGQEGGRLTPDLDRRSLHRPLQPARGEMGHRRALDHLSRRAGLKGFPYPEVGNDTVAVPGARGFPS